MTCKSFFLTILGVYGCKYTGYLQSGEQYQTEIKCHIQDQFNRHKHGCCLNKHLRILTCQAVGRVYCKPGYSDEFYKSIPGFLISTDFDTQTTSSWEDDNDYRWTQWVCNVQSRAVKMYKSVAVIHVKSKPLIRTPNNTQTKLSFHLHKNPFYNAARTTRAIPPAFMYRTDCSPNPTEKSGNHSVRTHVVAQRINLFHLFQQQEHHNAAHHSVSFHVSTDNSHSNDSVFNEIRKSATHENTGYECRQENPGWPQRWL